MIGINKAAQGLASWIYSLAESNEKNQNSTGIHYQEQDNNSNKNSNKKNNQQNKGVLDDPSDGTTTGTSSTNSSPILPPDGGNPLTVNTIKKSVKVSKSKKNSL